MYKFRDYSMLNAPPFLDDYSRKVESVFRVLAKKFKLFFYERNTAAVDVFTCIFYESLYCIIIYNNSIK